MKHPSNTLNSTAVIVSLAAIALTFFSAEAMAMITPLLLFISVVVLGIPHGAIDHIVAARVYGLNETLKGHLLFYTSYLFVMLLVGLLWLVFPIGGMVFFLMISIYHFGQADMVSLINPNSKFSALFAWSRGLLVIGIIIFGHPEVSLPIIETAIRSEPGWFGFLYENARLFYFGVLFLYFISFGIIFFSGGLLVTKMRFILESMLLIALLTFTGPLVSFAIYFALWHSAGHVHEMMEYFRGKGENITVGKFYRLATPFTAVSLLGLLLLFFVHQAYAFGDEMISLLFILISVLTLPHMFVVDRMFKDKN